MPAEAVVALSRSEAPVVAIATGTRQPCRGAETLESAPKGAENPVVAIVAFTVADLARMAGTSRQAILKAIKDGDIEARKVLSQSGRNKNREHNQIGLAAALASKRHGQAIKAAWEARNREMAGRQKAEEAAKEADGEEGRRFGELQDWQRRPAEARGAVLRHIRSGGEGLEQGISRFLVEAADGRLPPAVAAALAAANVRARKGKAAVTRRTIYYWLAQEKSGDAALAPKGWHKPAPAWLRYLLEAYQQPQKPSLAHVVEVDLPPMLAKAGIAAAPTYATARRWLMTVGEIDRQRGRMLPRELKNMKAYRSRDAESLEWPLVGVTADGHTFDAEVAHPRHGRPFRPEITVLVDIYTRKVVGLSVGLSESALTVMEAVRRCVLLHGVPTIFYCDNGSGYNNQWVDALMERVGTTKTNSIPYNSRARGLVERLHRTLWVDLCAKSLPTFMGADMDREARQIVHRDTRRNAGSKALISWEAFKGLVAWAVDVYNARPHRSLPMTTNEVGRRVHMSPNQKWQEAIDRGWSPARFDRDFMDELLPSEERVVKNCLVEMLGGKYYARALEQWHGRTVRVAFDPLDSSRVWVRDGAGVLLAAADLNGNSAPYFPKSFVEQCEEKKARAQERQALAKLGQGRGADLSGLPALEAAPVAMALDMAPERVAELRERRAREQGRGPQEDPKEMFFRLLRQEERGEEPLTAEEREFLDYYGETTAGRRIKAGFAQKSVDVKPTGGGAFLLPISRAR
jgi:putative transposase